MSSIGSVALGGSNFRGITVPGSSFGSLAGRNTAGVMNAIPRRAGFDSELDFDVEYGNRESLRTRGMLNLPILEDVLALRIAVQHERNGGFYH
ncbi:MAG TPA: hypothetical protein EYQ31_18355, partial [Candidatus Handelsmanbacteria bacterium]|nr:hypothetical protein [Candidatus Handelsmanbacteria bacterium]